MYRVEVGVGFALDYVLTDSLANLAALDKAN